MEKSEASAILGIKIEASAAEIEEAYDQRMGEVRKRFEAARGLSVRTQYKREFAAIREARHSLLTELAESPRPQPIAEDPSVEEPPVKEPPVGEPPAEEPLLGEPPAKEPSEEESPAAGKPLLTEPATAARKIEQPVGGFDDNLRDKSPGPTVSVPGQLRPGELFASRFELQCELEIGSTGAVWLAQDYSVRRQASQVALKFLPDFILSDKAAVEKLKSEIRRRIALKHPNILRIYDLAEEKGRVAIQMEYLAGLSLSRFRLTRPNEIFEVRDLEKWVKELCEALEYAHKDLGFIDGDIVPGNLIVDHGGSLKLKDFGIANCITASMSRSTVICDTSETLPYRSPQRAAGEAPTITDDLYSVGATLYELLTSKPPFYTGDVGVQVSAKIPPSMTDRRAELGIEGEPIPKNWEETVAACLAEDPVLRPQSALEVAKRLQNASPQSGIPAPSTLEFGPTSIAKPKPPVRPPPTRKPWHAVVAIIFILAFVLAIAFFSIHYLTAPKLEKLVLNTIPAKANVYLDGTSRGRTPLVLANVAPGDHRLRIELQGYEPGKLIVSVKRGDRESSLLIRLVAVKQPSPKPTALPSPSGSTGKASSPAVATPSVESSPKPSPKETATPNESRTEGPSPSPLSQPDIDATKEEVVKRINALPGITAEAKANMIEKMHKARSMERLTVIPFDIGQTGLHRAATDELVKTFARPEMRDKLNDPTIILVVAGYADTGGRADLNLRISQERAENVSRILKEQARLPNAMQTIGMGGTELLDSNRPDQNRAVEVWAVVPL